MARNISAAEAASRLESAGSANSDRYQKGVTGKGSKWAAGASKAGPNWKDGVTQAVAKDKFAKGVQEAGPGSYDSGVSTKGVSNWPTGMQQAGPKYQRKIAKFQPLWDQTLPTPRGSRRSPANSKRMTENLDRFVRTAGA